MKKILITILLVQSLFLVTNATHIVGGDITYTCLGNDQYEFTMNVYRDCAGIPPFDPSINFTVYVGDGTLFNTFSTSKNNESIVPLNLSPCITPPPNSCVEQADYINTFTLPFNSLGYFVVWQRCCRNNSIDNIGNPGDAGATFTTYLGPDALSSCNNSPTFKSFPPVIICVNEPINFDHGATDIDGDSLVYSFCAPSIGASPMTPAPPTASPPPYAPVAFVLPYTASAPLASNITIDATTGVITGTPVIQGQYVVGVCVEEYKNGVLSTRIKRDFQFNVGVCTNNIVADIVSDSISPSGVHYIESCVDTTITFQNQSVQLQNITGYLWEFNINGNIVTSTATDPTISFSNPGLYLGSMIVNPNSTGCTDTTYIAVDIHRNPVAEFSYTYDSCVIGPINFLSSSYSLDGNIINWNWDFDDDSTIINNTTPVYQYQDAGTFDVRLAVTDDIGCVDSIIQTITWAPTPIIDVVPSTASGCIPLDVVLENNSYPINGYSLFWTLGDGFTSTIADPVHTYQDTGLYTVTVYIESPLGCFATDTFVNIVNVRNPPTPNFYYLYDSCEYTPVEFYNTSVEGDGEIIQWNWSLEEDSTITAQGTTTNYQYTDVGKYDAVLRIIDDNDCELSLTKEVDWQPAPVFPVALPDFEGCEPLTIEVLDTTYPIDGYFTLWNFGDGYYSYSFRDSHIYENTGVYDMSLTVISRTNCVEEFLFPTQVTVHENPIADFFFAPNDENLPNIFEPTVQFTNNSIDNVVQLWSFDDEGSSVEENPTYSFQDTGLQTVTLAITNAEGCKDSISQIVDVKPSFTYYLPNAFTPNDDGKNDGYRGVGELFGVTNFKLQIWNRWGELIFESSDPLEAWNGRVRNTGEKVESGVYVVLATMTTPRGQAHEVKGFATVVN